MRLAISGLTLRPGESLEGLPRQALERLDADPARLRSWSLLRRSLDARGRREPRFVCTVGVELAGEGPLPEAAGVGPWAAGTWRLRPPARRPSSRPVVVGAGPAGLFAALRLCAYGLAPLVLERGAPIEERTRDVAAYWRRGELDPESNVQFGEGGAGTFSDGKLTYRGKDFRKVWVFERLVRAGAPGEILFEQHPHLGTDRLRRLLARLRGELLAAGAEVRFRTRVEALWAEGREAVGVETADERVPGGPVFLAVGHSARDLFAVLAAQGLALAAKPFAVGVRVELEQAALDACQYGRFAGAPGLPPSEFTVKARARRAERDVYSFCMCPGGAVIPAGTEADGTCVNGMSGSGRRGRRANAALVVAVGPADFGGGVFDGVAFQRAVERRVRSLGGARGIPAQLAADFLRKKPSARLPRSSCPWPLVAAQLEECLPPFVAEALREALPALTAQLPPLATATLLAAETRTSSPVRLLRGEDLAADGIAGVYPIGEGAGHAGGIVSAAVDGVRAADAYAQTLGAGVAFEEEPS